MPKRGTDHTWQLVRYVADNGIYARCKCGYHYCCDVPSPKEDRELNPFCQQKPFFSYCPVCGARKKWYTNEIKEMDKYSFEDI